MNTTTRWLRILQRAVTSGIVTLLAVCVILALIGLPIYGFGSPLIILFFWQYIVLLAPVGMMVGGYFAYSEMNSVVSKSKPDNSILYHTISLGLASLILTAMIVLPFLARGD